MQRLGEVPEGRSYVKFRKVPVQMLRKVSVHRWLGQVPEGSGAYPGQVPEGFGTEVR